MYPNIAKKNAQECAFFRTFAGEIAKKSKNNPQ
jgi:hypothetical protein